MLKFKDLYIAVVSDTSNQPAKPGPRIYLGVPVGGGGGKGLPDLSVEPDCPNQHPPSTECCEPVAQPLSYVVPNPGQNGWIQFDVVGPGTGKPVKLKDYLANELAKGEINITQTQQPQDLQSVDEIAKLEQKLNGALQELAARKAELKKKTRAAQ